ncbi:MAG TPA: IS1182 family transposase [Rhodothermia bacterium]|nr:IS1182 family transposase [Rhodothermia bacterium]
MPTAFKPYKPEQSFLLPPAPSDWLSEGHLAHFVSDMIDQLDLKAFYARYEGDGRRKQPYEPRMLLKVIVYSYMTGTFSSRKMARRIEEDIAVRYLAAGNFPSHRTICDFRVAHLEAFSVLLLQIIRIAQEAGLVKLGRIAIDGSKVRASASKHKAMSYDRMKSEEEKLEKQIAAILGQAAEQDAREDAEYGPDRRGDELPEELQRRESRLQKIREARQRLEQRQKEQDLEAGRSEGDDDPARKKKGNPFKRKFGVPADKAQENFTDPDSRIMNSTEGFQQCYNAQIAVDANSQLIVGTEVIQNAADNGSLLSMVELVEQNCGRTAEQYVADAGYKSEASFVELERKKVDAYVALGREGKNATNATTLPATQRMKEKLASPQGEATYRRRKAIVEPVFGWIKNVLGFRRFSLRGTNKVAGEWALVCMVVNLKRMSTLVGVS